MTQAYRLQLENWLPPDLYIITGDEWFSAGLSLAGLPMEEKAKFAEWTGLAIIYPEQDLLWIIEDGFKTERFKTLEDFEREFSSLPRWEATRYAVIETPGIIDQDTGRILSNDLSLFDCRTGERLVDSSPEVARLRRSIEPMMRGEHFSFI